MVDPGYAHRRDLGKLCVAALILFGGSGQWVFAGDLAYGTGYSFTYDTNPVRTSVNPASDQVHEVIAGIAYRESTGSINARLLAQAEARYYRRNTFADDSYVYLDGTAIWSIAPKTLDWTVEDHREETRIDLTAVDTPANRAVTNTFTTGPDMTLRLGRASAVVLGGRYGQVDVEGGTGNKRTTGYARIEYLLSGASKARLNYESSRIRVEPPGVITEARRDDLYARYEARTSPTDEMALEVGTTRVAFEDREQPSHRRVRLSIARRLASASAIRASLFDYLSDTFTDSLSRDTTVIAPPSTSDSYRLRGGGVSYNTTSGRLAFEVGAYTQQIRYETFGDDYEEDAGSLRLTWQRAADLRLNASAEHAKRLFPELGRTDVESGLGVGMTYQFTRTLQVLASFEYERSETSSPAATVTSRVVGLLLAYSSDPLYAPRSRR